MRSNFSKPHVSILFFLTSWLQIRLFHWIISLKTQSKFNSGIQENYWKHFHHSCTIYKNGNVWSCDDSSQIIVKIFFLNWISLKKFKFKYNDQIYSSFWLNHFHLSKSVALWRTMSLWRGDIIKKKKITNIKYKNKLKILKSLTKFYISFS